MIKEKINPKRREFFIKGKLRGFILFSNASTPKTTNNNPNPSFNPFCIAELNNEFIKYPKRVYDIRNPAMNFEN